MPSAVTPLTWRGMSRTGSHVTDAVAPTMGNLRQMTTEPHSSVHWPAGWGPDGCDAFIAHERRIAAPAESIFACLVAVEGWPRWQRSVLGTEAPAELEVGAPFVVRTVAGVIDGMIGELESPSRFGWAGVGDAISLYQSWMLVPEPGGAIRTILQEAARGSAALLRADERAEITRLWLDSLVATVRG